MVSNEGGRRTRYIPVGYEAIMQSNVQYQSNMRLSNGVSEEESYSLSQDEKT